MHASESSSWHSKQALPLYARLDQPPKIGRQREAKQSHPFDHQPSLTSAPFLLQSLCPLCRHWLSSHANPVSLP
jgi:hypothetical protein